MVAPRTPRPRHSERLVTKLTEEQLYLLERAAELSGLGVSGFVRQAAVARAKEVISKEAGVDYDHGTARTARR